MSFTAGSVEARVADVHSFAVSHWFNRWRLGAGAGVSHALLPTPASQRDGATGR